MATTEKLPSGRHRGIYYDAGGNKCRTPTTDRKRDALREATEAEVRAHRTAAAEHGTLPASITWLEWYPIWWDGRVIEPSTRKGDDGFVQKYILPYWGDRRLNLISHQLIQRWVNELRQQGKSDAHVRKIYAIFRSSITAAVRDGVLAASPCIAISVPGSKRQSATRLYDDDELDAIWAHLSPEYRLATGLILETGMRPGELGGLHRPSVDRMSGWLAVQETFDPVAGRIKAYPKDKDARDVPLTTRAIDLFNEWEELRPSTRTGCGVPHQKGTCRSDLVGRQPMSDGPIRPRSLYMAWMSAQHKAKISNPGPPYALRHGLATRLADAGVDPWEIARLLGHSTLEQTGVYVHRSPGARLKILAALGDPAANLGATTGRRKERAKRSRPTRIPRAAG